MANTNPPRRGDAAAAPQARKYTGNTKIKRSYALLWRQTLRGIGAAVAAFLLGRCVLLFGARPLGIALLCAATGSIPYLYGGLLISALTAGESGIVLCCTYTAALIIRVLSRSAIETPSAGRRVRVTSGDSDGDGDAEDMLSDREREIVSEGAKQDAETREKAASTEGRRVRRAVHIGDRMVLRTLPSRLSAMLSRWFCESIYLRMMTACVCAFIVSLYTIIAGGFLYYDLFGAFFAMATAPVATFLYAGLFVTPAGSGMAARDEARKGDKWWHIAKLSKSELRRTVALGALTFSVLYAMRDISLLGIGASAFCGFLLTLCVTRRQGLLPGLGTGLVAGLAFAPAAVPSFVLAALAFGLLQRFSRIPAACAACTVGFGWGLIIDGLEALTTVLPAYLAASLLVCAADKLIMHPSVLFELAPDVGHLEAVERTDIALQRAESGERRMKELSETFSSLAGIFYNLSDRLRRPGLLDLRRMCDRAFDGVCPECPQRDLCWGADYAGTLTQLSRMAAALHERGSVCEEDVDEPFRERCASLVDIQERMNAECARMTEAALRTEKVEVFAMDYDGLSQILSDALDEQNTEFQYDEQLCDRVCRALSEMDLQAQGVLVWGKRQRQIIARGVDASVSRLGTADIHARLEEACGFALGEIYFDLSDTGVTMRVSSRPRISTRRAVAVSGAQEGVSGDTVNVFDTDRGYTYALISDGMGSGREAAFTSGLCSLFLEKMLTAGNHTDTTLRMLNSMMRQKGGGIGMECSATVDLMELDLLSAKAVFLKSGASPTYVRRGDCLFKLHAETAPIGILRAVDAQRITYDAQPGDVIIMLSDGVGFESAPDTTTSPDPLWLLDLLADGWLNDLDEMASLILKRAREEGSTDDLSVVLVEIVEE